jgi:serine/threonine-protein kinase
MDREIALKIFPPVLAGAERERLLREARAAGRVRNPGIVIIHEAGEVQGTPFLAMELVPGRPLSAVRRLPHPRAAEVALEIARTLARAHAQGVIHRDQKPSNIRLRPDGRCNVPSH